METKQPPDIEEKTLKQRLLNEEFPTCVCCRLCEKSFIEGWQPKEEQKSSKKRTDISRGGNQGSLRRERTIITASKGDFLFRHYDNLDRYIKQYRENYSSTCMMSDTRNGVGPVLGVDFPDPYLPKIASSSILIERIKIIEAFSSYYCNERHVKNISLTGRKAISKESNVVLSSSKDGKLLPQIENFPSNDINIDKNDIFVNNTTDIQHVTSLPTLNEMDDECITGQQAQKTAVGNESFCSFAERLRRNQDVRDMFRVTSTGNEKPKSIESDCIKTKKESLILPSAKLVCNDNAGKSRSEEHNTIKVLFPNISLWAECSTLKQKKPDRVLEKLRIGKKVQISAENSTEELCDEILNLRRLETKEGFHSRGNLCLGKTVRPVTNHKEQQKKADKGRKNPADNTLQHVSKTAKNSPRETAFIRILGQPKGPIPLVKSESKIATSKLEQGELVDKSKSQHQLRKDCGIPLSYLRRFGRRSFHHVLEARSYKPETRKLGDAVIPN